MLTECKSYWLEAWRSVGPKIVQNWVTTFMDDPLGNIFFSKCDRWSQICRKRDARFKAAWPLGPLPGRLCPRIARRRHHHTVGRDNNNDNDDDNNNGRSVWNQRRRRQCWCWCRPCGVFTRCWFLTGSISDHTTGTVSFGSNYFSIYAYSVKLNGRRTNDLLCW